VDHPAARNAYLPLGGPQALSWMEVARVFERVLARPVTVNLDKPGEILPGQPDWVNQMLPGFETYESILDMGAVSERFGVTPTPLENFIQRVMAASR
jgi:hypothetical protein